VRKLVPRFAAFKCDLYCFYAAALSKLQGDDRFLEDAAVGLYTLNAVDP
jgi:hypothetical protein